MELASLGIEVDSRQVKTAKEWLDDLTDSGERAEKSMDGVGRGGRVAASGSAEAARGSRTATSAMTQQEAAASRLTATIRRYAIAAVGVFSISAIASQARGITELASRYNELGIVMDTVGRNAGYARPYLNELEKSLKATGISALESRSNIAKLIAANIDLTKATELARLAQDAAVIGGLNSSDAFARLTSGIQSAQVETLRTMGLNANFQKSYEDLAAELGKAAGDLSELEKTQARTNAVLALAPTIAGAYEASMTNAGKAMRSTQRYAEDLGVALGQAFQPAYEIAVATYTSALKLAADNVDTLKNAMVALSLTGIALVSGGLMALATKAIPAVIVQFAALTAAMMRNPFGLLAVGIASAIVYLISIRDQASKFSAEMDTLKAVWSIIADAAKAMFGSILNWFGDMLGSAKETTEKTQGFFERTFFAIADELDNLYGSFVGAGAAIGAIFETLGHNIGEAFVFAFAKAREAASDMMLGLSAVLAQIGVEWDVTPYVGPAKADFLSLGEAASEAFNKTKDAANLGARALLESSRAAIVADREYQALIDANDAYWNGTAKSDGVTTKLTETLTKNTKAVSAATKVAAAFAKARADAYRNHRNEISGIHQQAQALEDQVKVFGQGKDALERLGIARLQEQAAMLRGFEGSEEAVRLLELEIEARERLMEAGMSLGKLEEQKAVHDEMLADWRQTVDEYDRVFRDGFADMLNNGKSGWKSFTKSLVTTFKTSVADQIYKMFAQPFVVNLVANMMGMTGGQQGGVAGALQQGGGGAPNFNISMGGGIGNALASFGSTIGSSMVSQFGAGLTAGAGGALSTAGAQAIMDIGVGGSSSFSAGSSIGGAGLGSIMGYAGALYSLTQGDYGSAAGMAIGTAILPGIGTAVGGFIGGIVDSIFGGEPKTRRGKSTIYELDGLYGDDIYRKHDEIGHEDAYYRSMEDMTRASIDGINRTFEMIGVDAQLGNFWSRTDISTTGRGDGVASGGAVMVGGKWIDIGIPHATDDTSRGVGGWSDEPVLPRLALDLQLTMLEAFQAASEQMPTVLADMLAGVDIRGLGAEAAGQLALAFDAVIQQVGMLQTAVETLPFETLRDLSFDAAANLINFAGGLEQLDAGMTSYFQNFYSEAEQLEWQAKQIGGALEGLGLTMPDVSRGAEAAKSEYRALVESLDVTTEHGAQAYAILMTLSGGFAELVNGMDELNSAVIETARTAAEIARERTSLELRLAQAVGNTSVMRRAELDALDESNQALQMLIWAYQDAQAATNAAFSAAQRLGQEEIRRLQETATATDQAMSALERLSRDVTSSLQGVFALLQTSIRDLRGEVEDTAQMQYRYARAMISTALVTGQVSDGDAMQQAIRTARAGVETGLYASRFEQDRAYLTLAAELEQLHGITGKELTAAEETLDLARKQVNALRGIDDSINGMSMEQAARALDIALVAEEQANAQIAIIEEQLSWAEQQYNALRGLGDQFSTFAGAIDGLASAISAERAAQKAAQDAIADASRLSRAEQYLIDNPDVATEFITDALANSMGLEGYARWHYEKYGQHENRSFDVGTPFVPHDMTANIHRGEIIVDPRSSDILRRYGIQVEGSGGNDAATREEIKALREDIKAGLFQVAKNTNKTVKLLEILEQWHIEGAPPVRDGEARELANLIVAAIEEEAMA